MNKTYKNGLLKKNSYKSPKIRIFEKTRTKTDFLKKSVLVRTNPYEGEHCSTVDKSVQPPMILATVLVAFCLNFLILSFVRLIIYLQKFQSLQNWFQNFTKFI